MPNSFWRIPINPSHRNLISQFMRSLFLTIMSPELLSIQFVFEHKPIWYLASNSCPFDIWGFSVVLPSSLIEIQNHRYQNYSYSPLPSCAPLFFLVTILKKCSSSVNLVTVIKHNNRPIINTNKLLQLRLYLVTQKWDMFTPIIYHS